MDLILWIPLLTLVAAAAWLLARSHSKRLESLWNRRNTELEGLYDELNTKADADPVRMGIDIGKEYSANEIQKVADRLRNEIKS